MKQIILNIVGIVLALFSLAMCGSILIERNVKRDIELRALEMDKECYTKEDIKSLTNIDEL